MDMQRKLQDHITKMIMVRPDAAFSLLYPAIMCKHPTHPMTPITPSEILMAASSFDSNTASSSYEQKMKLIADCADMLRRNNAVYDAEHKKKEEAEHKKKKKIAQDEVSSVLNPRIMFKHPTHPSTPITPSEILMAACSSENTNTVDCNTASSSYVQLMELPEGKPELLEGDARILDMLFNSDVGNPEVEVKVVGDAKSTEIDEFVPKRELQNAVTENKEKFSCSQTSDLGIGMALNYAISSEFYITEEARQGDGASMSEPLAQPHSAKVSGSATATTTSQLETPNAKSRKQEWKNMQASGPSSPSPGVLNSIKSSNEAGGSSSPLSREAAVPQIMSLQDMMNQQMDLQRILQKHIAMMATVPITEEGERLEEAEHKKKTIARDAVSSVLDPAIMFKQPTHPMTPITPSEILMATNTVDSNTASSSYVQQMKLLEGFAADMTW